MLSPFSSISGIKAFYPKQQGIVATSVEGAETALAFNSIVSAYAGNVVRVRRSSDNAEQDIGTVGGVFDSATYDTFIGGGSGYVVTWYDQSGNGNDATQGTASAQMVIGESGGDYYATPDLSNDTYGVTFGNAVNGTLIDARIDGTVEGEIDVASGVWNFNADPNYGVPSPITSLVVYSSVLSEEDRILNRNSVATNTGAGIDFAGTTNMDAWFQHRTDLKKLHCEHFDTSLVTSFENFANGCSNLTTLNVSIWNTANVTTFALFIFNTGLTTLDVSGWNTAKVTSFSNFARSSRNLTTLDVSGWNTAKVTSFSNFANGCWALTTLDVSNWNTSLVSTFYRFAIVCSNLTTITTEGGTGNPFADSPSTSYTSAFQLTNLDQTTIDNILTRVDAAGTSSVTFTQSGGSAPSSTGEAAIDALRARSWNVSVTGGY